MKRSICSSTIKGTKTKRGICSPTIEGTKTKRSIGSSTIEGTKTKRSIWSSTIERTKMKRSIRSSTIDDLPQLSMICHCYSAYNQQARFSPSSRCIQSTSTSQTMCYSAHVFILYDKPKKINQNEWHIATNSLKNNTLRGLLYEYN